VRDAFPEFYQPTANDEKRFIVDGIVVVDANVLLALYELSAVQRNETLGVLEAIGDRLWIPYQVGLEYQRNRLGVIQRQASHYTRLVNLHGARDLQTLTEALSGITVPDEVAEEVRPLLSSLAERLSEATADYVEAAKELRRRHVVTAEQGVNDDPVRRQLDELFRGRVGQRPDAKTHESRISKAAQRREKQIPPGYKDDKKPSDERSAGDYLLWAELLEHAEMTASDGRPFLLVTNDVKDDWYAKSGREPTGPRPELAREFHACNSNGYHQVTLEGMLRLAKSHLAVDVDDATIEKASELSRPDFFFDESVRNLAVDDPARYEERARMRAGVDQQVSMGLLVDRLCEGLFAAMSESDVVLIRSRLMLALMREVQDFVTVRWNPSWTDRELRASARMALHNTIRRHMPDSPRAWPEDLDFDAVGLFVHIVRSYRQSGMPRPDEG
jgi:hypothetical protein